MVFSEKCLVDILSQVDAHLSDGDLLIHSIIRLEIIEDDVTGQIDKEQRKIVKVLRLRCKYD